MIDSSHAVIITPKYIAILGMLYFFNNIIMNIVLHEVATALRSDL